jgi:hypothetical protein
MESTELAFMVHVPDFDLHGIFWFTNVPIIQEAQ